MRALRAILTIVIAIAFSGAVNAQNPPNPQLGSISGTLMNREGAPAASIRLSAVPVADNSAPIRPVARISLTDASGRFRLENIVPGSYWVTAGRVDLPTYFPGVTVQSGATMVTVVAGQAVAEINFSMQTPLGLRFGGRVIRQDSEGVVLPAAAPGATGPPFQAALGYGGTQILRLTGSSFTQTNGEGVIAPDGTFQFANLAPGTYQITLAPVIIAAQRITVTLTDRDITDYQFVVPLMVTVSGTMTVEGGGPVPRVQMAFTDANPQTPLAGAVPIPVGLALVSPGAFTAQLRAGSQKISLIGIPDGFTVKSITSGGVDMTRNPLKVAPDVGPIQIVFGTSSPSPWVRAAGRVEGRGEWHVLVNFNSFHPQMESTLDPIFYLDGSFEFPMTLPGAMQIRTNAISGPTLMSTVSAGARGIDNAVINVPSTVPSTIGTQPDAGIRAVRVGGRIVGKALASRGARVLLHNGTVGETFNAPIFMDGSFEFPRVSPGVYTAAVYPPVPGASPAPVTVGDTDMKDLRIRVPDTKDFRGRVQMEGNPGNAPMPRTLTFSFASGTAVSANLGANGSFRVELPIGQKINVAASSIPRGHSLQSMTYGTVDLRSNPIPTSEAPAEEFRVTFRSTTPTANVSGRVTGNAALLPGSVVWLADSAGVYQTLEAAVASDRTFTFAAVAPGSYTARLSAPVTNATRSSAVAAVVVAGGNVAGIEIVP